MDSAQRLDKTPALSTLVAGVVLATAFLASNTLAQTSDITFANDDLTLVVNGITPVNATNGIRAALYWAPVGNSNFFQLGASVVVGVPVPGIFAGGTRFVTNLASGELAQFQVRAWGGGYTNYEEAAAVDQVLLGESPVFQAHVGGLSASPPTPPGSLTGLSSFSLITNTLPSLPLLTIRDTHTNNVIVSWPSPSTGFVLQQTTNLSPTDWSNITNNPVDSGGSNSVILPIAGSQIFYRLRK